MKPGKAKAVRILIADDHPLIREGLKTCLQDEVDMKVVAEARTGHEVLQYVQKERPDLVILDISLPEKSGLDVLKDLKALGLKIPVLVLTMHPEKRYALRALKAGARGYLTKGRAPTELVQAIRKVVSGGKYISETVAEILAIDPGAVIEELPHETLSDREYQVFTGIASGKSVRQIADELSLSEATVYTYRERILGKMKMNSVAELTRYALEHELID
jgi:DNA-binding NarL/FixJ family response regulator